jgi:hypothetical protein
MATKNCFFHADRGSVFTEKINFAEIVSLQMRQNGEKMTGLRLGCLKISFACTMES